MPKDFWTGVRFPSPPPNTKTPTLVVGVFVFYRKKKRGIEQGGSEAVRKQYCKIKVFNPLLLCKILDILNIV